MADYDANSDGKLDEGELKKCPSLKSAIGRIDKDRDGQLTAEEIAARMQQWLDSGTTLMDAGSEVTLDQQPLEGATVTFEPERFLGESYKASSAVTDQGGQVSFDGAVEGFPGVYVGFYRVRISKLVDGKETIPSRYNSESELGCEVADDIPDRLLIQFHLQSR